MPNANGHTNGHGNGATYDMEDGQSFLFTSESVGEGHPGEKIFQHGGSYFRVGSMRSLLCAIIVCAKFEGFCE